MHLGEVAGERPTILNPRPDSPDRTEKWIIRLLYCLNLCSWKRERCVDYICRTRKYQRSLYRYATNILVIVLVGIHRSFEGNYSDSIYSVDNGIQLGRIPRAIAFVIVSRSNRIRDHEYSIFIRWDGRFIFQGYGELLVEDLRSNRLWWKEITKTLSPSNRWSRRQYCTRTVSNRWTDASNSVSFHFPGNRMKSGQLPASVAFS